MTWWFCLNGCCTLTGYKPVLNWHWNVITSWFSKMASAAQASLWIAGRRMHVGSRLTIVLIEIKCVCQASLSDCQSPPDMRSAVLNGQLTLIHELPAVRCYVITPRDGRQRVKPHYEKTRLAHIHHIISWAPPVFAKIVTPHIISRKNKYI